MKRPDAGFTLLEILISITIFALLMVVLVGALQLGSRQVGRLAGQVDRSSQIALVQNFLRAQLSAAQPLAESTGDAKTVQFDGRANRVDFVSVAPQSRPAGGLQVLSVGLREGGGDTGGQLVAGWRPLRHAADKGPDAAPPTVLLDHVRAARFVYYGPPSRRGTPDWQQTWQKMDHLPQLVRLSVTFDNGETMPDLSIALRLAPTAADLRLNQGRPP